VVTVYDQRNGQSRNVEVWPVTTAGAPASDVKYRFNWEFPLVISPFDHNRVYVASQVVHMTTNGGQSWQVISPDLTLNDRSKMGISGGLAPDNIGVEYAGVIFALAESPKQQGLLWAGTNDGQVQLSKDGGKTWSNLTKNLPDLPPWGTIDNIEPSPFDPATAYLTVDFHQMDNRDPFVYRTHDYGQTWTKITSGITPSPVSYAHCVIEDPNHKGLLFLGTEGGAYVSFHDGDAWQPLQNNLPHAPVYWLAYQPRRHDLVAATYGRGFWILDDVTPLEDYSSATAQAPATLFAPRPEYRFRGGVTPINTGYEPSDGNNPPAGAAIDYYVQANIAGGVHLAVVDRTGKTVDTLNGPGSRGFHRVYWSLRSSGSPTVRLRTLSPYAPELSLNAEGWRPAPNNRALTLLEPPGTYTIELHTGDAPVQKQTLTLLKDPHSSGTLAGIQTQWTLANQIFDEYNQVTRDLNQIEMVRAQLNMVQQALALDPPTPADLIKAASAVNGKLLSVEGDLYNTKATGKGEDQWRWAPTLIDKLSYLENEVTSSDFPPTDQQIAVNADLAAQVRSHTASLDAILKTDVAALNASLRGKNIPNVITAAGQP